MTRLWVLVDLISGRSVQHTSTVVFTVLQILTALHTYTQSTSRRTEGGVTHFVYCMAEGNTARCRVRLQCESTSSFCARRSAHACWLLTYECPTRDRRGFFGHQTHLQSRCEHSTGRASNEGSVASRRMQQQGGGVIFDAPRRRQRR